jgi:hypothetical protein
MAGGLLAASLVFWSAANGWFGRGSILALAPTDTVLAIELRLNHKTAPFLFDWLSGVPLISDRSLELRDLAPFTHGELAIFVTKEGNRSVAIRANLTDLPTDLLNHFAIPAQEQGSFILLSSSLQPMMGTQTNTPGSIFPSLEKTWLGRMTLPVDHLSGNLFLLNSELLLELMTPKTYAHQTPHISGAAISMKNLEWGSGGIPLNGLEHVLAGMPEPSLIMESSERLGVIVRPTEDNIEVLLAIENPEASNGMLVAELERIGSLARPTLITQILPDGSIFEEILVQPELVSVEETSTNVGTSYRVPTRGGSSIVASRYGEEILFSNSQTLFEDYVGNQAEPSIACEGTGLFINPGFLINQAVTDHASTYLAIFHGLFDDFSGISFEIKKYSVNIHLCRI